MFTVRYAVRSGSGAGPSEGRKCGGEFVCKRNGWYAGTPVVGGRRLPAGRTCQRPVLPAYALPACPACAALSRSSATGNVRTAGQEMMSGGIGAAAPLQRARRKARGSRRGPGTGKRSAVEVPPGGKVRLARGMRYRQTARSASPVSACSGS